MALSQVEDYADELNELAGQVRRNLELIGRLDETSHGKLDALKQQQAQYMAALKERVKAQKGKAAGAELQASTEDAQAMAALQELHKDILSKGQEKISVAERTEEMVQVELDKLEAFMAKYQEELRSSGKWADGSFDDDFEIDDYGDTPTVQEPSLARNFSVGNDSSAPPSMAAGRSTGSTGLQGLRDSSAMADATMAALTQGALSGIQGLGPVALMNLANTSAANQALLEQQALLPGALARTATGGMGDLAQQLQMAAAGATTTASATHDAEGNPTTADNPRYCFCRRVALGEMIGCDNDDCQFEWFHLPCVKLPRSIEGTWYCPSCVATMRKSNDPALDEMKEGFTEFTSVKWPTLVAMDEANPQS